MNQARLTIRNKIEALIKTNSFQVPVNLKDVALFFNVKVHYFHLPERIAGVKLPFRDGSYVIILNSRHSIRKRRYTLAHELGHIELGHFPSDVDIITNEHHKETDRQDREAEIFAAELLMPETHVRKSVNVENKHSLEELCKLYGVSKQAMQIRLDELNIQLN